LKESESIVYNNKAKYWIAERYFEGKYIKYNNNYGYISEDTG
jgi:hypothetical protein